MTCSCKSKVQGHSVNQDSIKLYPFLHSDGLYGYVNEDMQWVIPPQYREVSLFSSTGYAVVRKHPDKRKNVYGVINKQGSLVIPFAYRQIELKEVGDQTLIWTKKLYINRLRFWDWGGILFGDNFFSGADFLETKVYRSKIQLSTLETRQKIRQKRSYELAIGTKVLPVDVLDSTHILQGDQLFDLNGGEPKRLASGIYGKTRQGDLLLSKGTTYRLINAQGHEISPIRYKKRKQLQIHLGEKTILYPLKNIKKTSAIFLDTEGRQYLFPDLHHAFPQEVQPITTDQLAMDTILNRTLLYPSTVDDGHFYFGWNYILNEKQIFELDRQGQWLRHGESKGMLYWLNHKDDIPISEFEHIVRPSDISQEWNVKTISHIQEQLYLILYQRQVKGTRVQQRMGVWDDQTRQWAWLPQHAEIQALDTVGNYWKYWGQYGDSWAWGIYHLPSKRYVTEAKYWGIFPDGWVTLGSMYKEYARFWMDWEHGKEYRTP